MANRSVNLTNRNEKVIEKFFKTKGRNGRFSSWVNMMMDQEFVLDPEESIRQQIKKNKIEITKFEDSTEMLLKKLRIVIDKKNEK